MGIKELRASTGLSQKGFSEAFQIPVRTLQQWEQGKSSPAPYVLAMMEKLAPATAADAAGEKNPYFVPEKSHWKVCIPDPFPNCERVYPLQQRKVRQLLDALRGQRCGEVGYHIRVERYAALPSGQRSGCVP